jgi:NAD(P)H-dependent flavin oxidoreductase YrpB (nitropropane dioxygenase family)
VTELLGLDHPVLSAAIAILGVDLVAAGSNAGGLEILGTTSLPPAEIHDVVATLQRRTTRPFGHPTSRNVVAWSGRPLSMLRASPPFVKLYESWTRTEVKGG